ncbi:MAG: tetratricopeptide repeat protein [Lachnospiraceae bacterium]|nr:tetratricopeptide repeat protein [Lachnospiraceae bacterium]
MKYGRIFLLTAGMAALLWLGACGSPEAKTLNEQGLTSYNKGEYTEAVAAFNNAIVADNRNPEYYVNKGMAYLELEDYENAHSSFDSALRLDGKCQAAYRGNGIAHMEAGNYEEAMNSLNAALACEAGRAGEAEYDILLYRGETQLRMEDYAGAIDTYTVLLDTKGETAQIYYLRGTAYVKNGDAEAGTADMDKAVALNQADYSLYLNCYYCLADAGQEEAGVRYLQKALMIGETNTNHKARGTVHFLLGDYSAALSEFEYEKDKADVETLIYIGLCYQSTGEYERSNEAFTKALESGGENAEVYYQMGMCMFSMGDYEAALLDLEKGLELGGGAHKQEMLYTQALCYERLRRFEEACRAFESYAALYGSTPEIDRELAFLRTR